MFPQPLQLTASSAVVLACPYPISQDYPKAESNRRRVVLRIRWMRISDCFEKRWILLTNLKLAFGT